MVLITGAGSGFGRGLAFELARRGLDVVAGAQIWPQVWQLRQEADQLGLPLRAIRLDLLDEFDLTHAAALDIDVLMSNAGIANSGTLTDLPMELFRRNLETNLSAALDLTKRFLPGFIRRGSGRILFTSSDAGLQTPPFGGAYTASKWALEAVAATLRDELAPKGITVQTVQPGFHLTGFHDTALEGSTYWYDERTALLPGWQPPFTLDGQEAPEPIVDLMADLVTGVRRTYRNVWPPATAEEVKQWQANEWTREA